MWMRWCKKMRPPEESQMLELRLAGGECGKALLVLYPYYDEYWDRFPSAALDIVGELFQNLHVLTMIHAFSPSSKITQKNNVYSGGEMFLQIYFETLRLHKIAEGLQYHHPGDCISQTRGANTPLSALLFSGNYGILTYDAYGYTSLPVMDTFQQMKEQIENTPYALHFEYGRYPDEIHLTADKEKIPLAYCVSRIRDICQAIAVPLKIDPKLLQQIQ